MMQIQTRKSTNLTLDAALLSDAKALHVNLSRAAENGVRLAVAQARADQWRAENAAAVASSNSFADAHGLPLDRFRQF